MTVVRWTGREARLLRLAMRLGQREFAARLGISDTAVAKYERPARRDSVRLRYETQQLLDTVLALADEAVRDRFHASLEEEPEATGGSTDGVDVAASTRAPLAEHPILARLRSGLIARRPHDETGVAADGQAAAAQARAGHEAYQRGDYLAAADLLLKSVVAADELVRNSAGAMQRRAQRALALGNVGISKLAVKLGDASLAWISADRASAAARQAGSRVLTAAASYQVACALLAMPGRLGDAEEVLDAAGDELDRRHRTPDRAIRSVRGALILLAALISARQAHRADALDRLARAEQIADGLGGDGNHGYTAFGPTNVAIHRVSAYVELRDPSRAIGLGAALDTSRMPPALLSRRAQVHMDLAAAHAMTRNGDSPAVLHLLEAERIAPQVIGANHRSRCLLTELAARDRRSATPGLRALAERSGVLG